MNETWREIALAATIVGGLVIGTVAAGQAVGGCCGEDRGGALDRANRVHVVLSTTELGASRIPAFDGVEVDWSAGRQEGTSRLSAALVFCPTQEQEAACQESLDAGEARREALHELSLIHI